MKNVRVTKPSIEVGFSSGNQAITTNGQTWGQSPRVAGAAYVSGVSVIAVRSGRKLVQIGSGGLYAPRTTA